MRHTAVIFALAAALILSPMIRAGVIRETDTPVTPEPVAAASIRERDETMIREKDEPAEPRPHARSLGSFTLTAYCACPECCGKAVWDPAYGITASGTTVQQGRTVAVDPEVIPLGSVLYINGERYVAEDTGGAITGNHVDIYFNDHQDALEFGVQEAEVWLWE